MRLPSTLGEGWYAAALSIEDFLQTDPNGRRISVVPLQFLIKVERSSSPCEAAQPPKLVLPGLPDGTCVPIPAGSTYTTILSAQTISRSSRFVAHHMLASLPRSSQCKRKRKKDFNKLRATSSTGCGSCSNCPFFTQIHWNVKVLPMANYRKCGSASFYLLCVRYFR